jgi:RNA polymerase-binding transcription factor DksA
MASKKKTAPKKPAKSVKKAVAKKPAAKKPAKKVVAKKPAPKKPAKPVAKKPVKPEVKVAAKPAAKPVIKQAVKPVPVAPVVAAKPVAPPPPLPKKPNPNDPKSLVTIKPPVKQVLKKEPIKPAKVVMPKITTKSSVKYEPEFTKSVLDAQAMEHNGPTQRYSDPELNEFREIIQKKLDAAKKELAYLQGLITRKDESGGDMDEGRYMTMEDGSVSMEREQLSQMASRQITFIDHLEKAMMRIENKTYGICRVTGKLIDKARLRAVPHATLSIEAKQMMSK